MEFNFAEILSTLLPQLGFAVIFIYLFQQEKADNKANIEKRDTRIKEVSQERDQRVKEMTDAVLDLSKQHVEVLTSVRDTIANNTRAMEKNTESIQLLAQKIQTANVGRNLA
jgi:hydroxypyruvate isomerase